MVDSGLPPVARQMCEDGDSLPAWRQVWRFPMGNKDKGRRDKSSKKAASKSLKEKRAAKKTKKASHQSHGNRSVDQTFGH
jgi:hypothetical protein